MEFKDLVTARYSLRKFSDRPVEQEKLDLVLRSAHLAPTAVNYQPQHVFVLKSEESLEKANRCTKFHFGAPMILVVAYDPTVAWTRGVDKKNHGEMDASMVACHMMLQAAELGLGTTFIGVYDPEALRKEFPEMEGYETICLMPIGYAAEGAKPAHLHTDKKPYEDMITEL